MLNIHSCACISYSEDYQRINRKIIYAELFMGGNDTYRNCICCFYRKDAGHNECRAGFLQRGRHPMHNYDGGNVSLGGAYGDCGKSGDYRECLKKNTSPHPFPFPEPSGGPLCRRTDNHKYYRQCTGAWVGGDSGRALSYNNDRLKKSLKNQGFPPI